MFHKAMLSLAILALALPVIAADSVSGTYLESRTCQVYTGPCFAMAETALAGHDAMMAWNIETGTKNNVDLSGLSVVMVVSGNDTLAYDGVEGPAQLKSAVIVDAKANSAQREALLSFVKEHTGRAGREIVRIDTAPIAMSLDSVDLRGELKAGEMVKLSTRKAKPSDCICSNEVAFYPPLTKVNRFAAGVAIEAACKGAGLGVSWTDHGSRSVYMGEFTYHSPLVSEAGSE